MGGERPSKGLSVAQAAAAGRHWASLDCGLPRLLPEYLPRPRPSSLRPWCLPPAGPGFRGRRPAAGADDVKIHCRSNHDPAMTKQCVCDMHPSHGPSSAQALATRLTKSQSRKVRARLGDDSHSPCLTCTGRQALSRISSHS